MVRSLAVSGIACLPPPGSAWSAGAWLASPFPGRGRLLGLNTLLALPSVVVGLVVYLLLSRGPARLPGLSLRAKAMVLAQTILVLPVFTALTRQVVDERSRQRRAAALAGRGPVARALLLLHER